MNLESVYKTCVIKWTICCYFLVQLCHSDSKMTSKNSHAPLLFRWSTKTHPLNCTRYWLTRRFKYISTQKMYQNWLKHRLMVFCIDCTAKFFMTSSEWMVWPQCGPVRPTARGNYNNVEKDRWDEVISGKFLAHLLEFTPGQLSSLLLIPGRGWHTVNFFVVSFQFCKTRISNLKIKQ